MLHHTQVLEQLTTARVALETATQNYIAACDVIEAHCNREFTSVLDKRALEKTYVAINPELAFPAIYAQRLWKARVTLSGLRNRSPVLSPVNSLPAKILTSIFIKAVQADRASRTALAQRAREEGETRAIAARLRRPDMTTVISSVNTYWRQISTQTRELWSHIDLGESGARTDPLFAKARLWLERSQGSPLYVTITTTGPAAKVIDTWGILPILRSHETNLHSLDLDLNTIDEVHAALAQWLNEGAPKSLGALTISISWATESGESPHALPPGLLHREERDAFFEPIRTLDLDGTYLTWSGPAFQNLVDLRLSRISDHVCPTVEQFVGMLHGSPYLRTLSLRRMNLRTGGRVDFAPVTMKNLQILGLEHVEPQGICLLLPLLAPELELYVKIEGYTHDPGEVGDTLNRVIPELTIAGCHISVDGTSDDAPRLMDEVEKCLNDSVPDLLLSENSLIVD
ncbi:hypothetical protein RSAG8_11084, partial [Rhizoctonia solani AG-8 WAC10335]